MEERVLISGAGVAGLTLAYWLNRLGYEVTVAERSAGLRRGGSPIDIRGSALQIAGEMGILEEIRARQILRTDRIVNAANETLAAFSINAQAEYQGDLEMHRDDLIDILYRNLPADSISFLFGTSVSRLNDHGDDVNVTFSNGQCGRFRFVFGADGTHSAVRRLVFGKEDLYSRFFGAYFAFTGSGNITPDKPDAAVLYHEPGTLAMIYPGKHEAIAGVIFRSPKLRHWYRDEQYQKQVLRDRFSNGSWRIPEILDGLLRSDDLYFDEVSQIHMPVWSLGRIALLGDAAHATSFPTGMGTSLAMQGAAALAKELRRIADHTVAFKAYHDAYKPYVKSIQSRISGGLDWLVPETEQGIRKTIDRFRQAQK
jgi:2-polyprenyl-6-methoxyphenol hydroxylase-like FAD-dependent oxidoreductase